MSIQDTVCRYAWDYPIVSFNRNGLRNCCRAAPSDVAPSDTELGVNLFTQFQPLVRMKRDLLMGIKTPACSACWQIEAKGGKSPRSGYGAFIEFLRATNFFGSSDKAVIESRLSVMTLEERDALVSQVDHPRVLELSISTVCDLKCLYCNHRYSTQWAVEMRKYGEIPIADMGSEFPIPDPKFTDLFWQWFERGAFRTIKGINFIGGEPLLVDEFYETVDRILAIYADHRDEMKTGVTFSIITNFNTPARQFTRFLDFVQKIKETGFIHLDLNVSAEATGNRAGFIRSGCDWERINFNIRRFLQETADWSHKRCTFGFISSLNVLSISSLPRFLQYAHELLATYGRDIHLRRNQIVFPAWMPPSLLPAEYAGYIDDAIAFLQATPVDETKMIEAGFWSGYAEFLRTIRATIDQPDAVKDHHARREFKTRVLQLADRRGMDLYGTFPEMRPFFDMIEVFK